MERFGSWNYIGEIGRSLKTRKAEHIRNVKHDKKGSNVAKHVWSLDHAIDFDAAEVIDKGNFRTRKTLESWHTALSDQADNNSKPLSGQYILCLQKNDKLLYFFALLLVNNLCII